ncbi:hypothetical protein F2Q68_00035806 [Brassica cretica]|uniref:Uncharacterized protein n=1 Tax=Brassica cretica TaxID=69181 RepID=A0A8S9H6L6_BRACR|nr:hypothetical protein F2Q68_00035806 [Brassica cretica]
MVGNTIGDALTMLCREENDVGEEDAPRGSGKGDSSADEEQPTNRRRIEVILSRKTSSSDDENDYTPVLEDLRDVLKRKFESEDSNSFARDDLRTALDARKSRRISTSDPDHKERLNADLRDKLNAGACNLRIHLNRSKSTDLRRRLEQTKKGSGKGGSSADEEQPTNRRRIEVILSRKTSSSDDENDYTPVLEDLRDVLKRKFESKDSNSFARDDLRTALDARKSRRISTSDPNHKERPNADLRDKLNAGSGEGDSSADEEQPTNRRRIEVIFSQQTSSSDDENDNTPVLENLRDVLKRKFEFEDSNSFKHNDLRTALDAWKSRRISTSDPDPKERPNADLRDKLNAGACDLRIRLNRSKSTDLRRRLEQIKKYAVASSIPTRQLPEATTSQTTRSLTKPFSSTTHQ